VVAYWKTWIFCRLASCTKGQVGRLHHRIGQWAAHWGPTGCRKRQAGGLLFSAARPVLFRSPPDRLFVLSAGSPFCLLCSPPASQKFTFFIWKHGPPARRISNRRWDRIRNTGVDSGRILHFSFEPGPDPESIIWEKPHPYPESLFNFGSSRSLYGHFLIKNMGKLRLDWWL